MRSKLVLIIAEKVSDRVLLLAKLWKSCGFKTCLIYCNESLIFETKKNIFDIIVRANDPDEIIAISQKIENVLIHYFNYGPDKLGLCLLDSRLPYLLDYKDLFSQVRPVNWVKDLHDLEKLLIINAKYITARDRQIENYLMVNKLLMQGVIISVPEAIDIEPDYEIKLVKSIHYHKNDLLDLNLVMTGGYLVDSDEKPNCDGVSKVIDGLIGQGINVTIIGGYSNTNSRSNKFLLNNADKYLSSGKLKILDYMTEKDFEDKLLEFDFAIHMCNSDIINDPEKMSFTEQSHFHSHEKYVGSARFYSYIRANLPIVLGESRHIHIIENFRKSGLLIPVSCDEFINLKNILFELKKLNIRQSSVERRREFSFDNLAKNYNNQIVRLGILSNR